MKTVACLFLGMTLLVAAASANVLPPLYIANEVPVLDATGRSLRGSRSGNPAERCLVEIRTVPAGATLPEPPLLDGSASPNNPLLAANSFFGFGMNSKGTDPGVFCGVVPSYSTSTRFFVRAYNAPTAAAASRYADTPIYSVPSDRVVIVAFGELQSINPSLDELDSDGDGVPDWLEIELGLDPFNPDTDGDGFDDGFELANGMDPLIPYTFDVLLDPGEYIVDPAWLEARGVSSLEELMLDDTTEIPYVSDPVVSWYPMETGLVYKIHHSTNLVEGFDPWTNRMKGISSVKVGSSIPVGSMLGFFYIEAVQPSLQEEVAGYGDIP